MKKKKIIASDEKKLKEIAEKFSKNLKKKDIVFLNGELGSGKTTFVKGVGKGLNIKKIITSPTFQIIKEYEKKLCHIDAYRISEEDLGIEEYIEKNYIVFVEWPINLPKYIKPKYVINIKYLGNGREVEIINYE